MDALGTLLRDIGEALIRYSETRETPSEPTPGLLSWKERVGRQRLILQEFVDRGGTVDKSEWLEIAGRHGYTGRAVSGFFRSGDSGLLSMQGNKVSITEKGLARLHDAEG